MNSQEFLASLLRTTQVGQVEIRSILDTAMGPGLRTALEDQLHEYDSMETEALTIALQRGWELPELDPGMRFMADRLIRLRLNGRNTDSTIADIMIQKNTKAMIRGIKNLHRLRQNDRQIQILSQKVLDCETANVQHLQQYL